MCVLAFDFDPSAQKSAGSVLKLISNRDEFLTRPTLAAHWWSPSAWSGTPSDQAELSPKPSNDGMPIWILGGRDLRAGGSWLAISRAGRIAILTNYRDPSNEASSARSRGDLVEQWVGLRNAQVNSEALAQELAGDAQSYTGFNLLLFDCSPMNSQAKAWIVSNRDRNTLQEITPGIHGLSNEVLNSPWPKTLALQASLRKTSRLPKHHFETQSLSALVQASPAPDDVLPKTGIPLERERYLSSVFIQPPDIQDELAYGTRCSTVLHIAGGRAEFLERSYYPHINERRFSFPLKASAAPSDGTTSECRTL
jgi:uncharacterized protein with NRDE domain